MKKGYYIYFNSTDSLGVIKKIKSQLSVLEEFFDIEFLQIEKEQRNFLEKIYNILPWISNSIAYDNLIDKLSACDFVYIRAILFDKGFISFLSKLKSKNPKCKVLIEFPTFPYNKEIEIGINSFFYIKDKIYHRHLVEYVDRIVTYSEDSQIYRVPTIKVMNGITVDSTRRVSADRDKNKIVLLAVAQFQKAHGYERVIKGFNSYYKQNRTERVELHFVGEGTELQYYKRLVKRYNLEQYVVFYGRKEGKELDNIYDKADMGLSIFGAYKRGIERSSALKVREYWAKGLPIVTGCYEDVLDMGKTPFIYSFPNQRTEIDINIIVDFYHTVYNKQDYLQIHDEIREYAKNVIDIQVTMKRIIDYLSMN